MRRKIFFISLQQTTAVEPDNKWVTRRTGGGRRKIDIEINSQRFRVERGCWESAVNDSKVRFRNR